MKITQCRLCQGNLSEPKINLGSTPLANEFLSEKTTQELFPLEVCRCTQCYHYQLNESIDPERLFRHYVYVAGTSPVNVKHFKDYAVKMSRGLTLSSKVLDIASNDGTLLQHFKDLGMQVLGIDPAKNIADIANANGIETLSEFFTEQYSDVILKKYGKFDLITANNVFAHIPDMIGFTKGVKNILAPNGLFTFEVSYFLDVCKSNLIDTIYHEHTSYHTLLPLINFFVRYGLDVVEVERLANHGGSIRVTVAHYNKKLLNSNCNLMLSEELQLFDHLKQLNNKIKSLQHQLSEVLSEGKTVAIYGMPAKATTLLYALNIDENLIKYAVDDNQLKQNTYSPGKHIPVYSPDKIYQDPPDYLLILAWNFSESIVQKCRDNGFKGDFIIPLPEFSVIKGSNL